MLPFHTELIALHSSSKKVLSSFVTAASRPPSALTPSPICVNFLTVSSSSHTFSASSTFPSHLPQAKLCENFVHHHFHSGTSTVDPHTTEISQPSFEFTSFLAEINCNDTYLSAGYCSCFHLRPVHLMSAHTVYLTFYCISFHMIPIISFIILFM